MPCLIQDDPRGQRELFTEKPQYLSGSERVAKLEAIRDFVGRHYPDSDGSGKNP
ncbi:MAG: hypothetical protein R3F02_06255 [Thiolinea sp.]